MKNKKLFAILTLVCFMFTLMPVAAFAAEEEVVITDRTPAFGSIAEQYVNVKTNDPVKVKISQAGNYYVYATMGGTLLKDQMLGVATTGSAIGLAIVEATVADGGEVTLKFPVAGEYEIGVAKADNALLANIIAGGEGLVASETVLKNLKTFSIQMINDDVTVNAKDAKYTISEAAAAVGSLAADNGFSAKVYTVKLVENVAENTIKSVYNADLKITTDSHAIKVTKIDQKTLVDGTMQFKVTATIPGTYHVYVAYENAETYPITVQVGSATATDVSVLAAPVAPLDKDLASAKSSGIVFGFSDATGYAYELTDTDVNDEFKASFDVDYKVTLTEAPVGFPIKTTKFQLVWGEDSNGTEGWLLTLKDDATNGVALDREGKYTFVVALQNGASATATVTVGDFDEAKSIIFNKVANTVVVDSATFKVLNSQVLVLDAKGVAVPVAFANAGALKLSANGAAVEKFEAIDAAGNVIAAGASTPVDGYKLTVKEDDKYIGTKITLIAVVGDGINALTTTQEIVVTEDAATVKYVNTDAETGKMAELVANVVDANGDKVKVADADVADVDVIVLERPADAVVYANGDFENGQVVVNFLASEAGEYKIQTVVEYGANRYISGIETITVGGAKGDFKDVIVMSIGANKMVKNSEVVELLCAPVIKDSRTFVPFRSALEAFGATVDYIDGQVIAEMNGVKVVMTAGDKAYTVNGVAKVADVAPYLNVEASTTMVPVSFVVSEFGINFECIYNADGTVADVLFTK